MTPFQRCCGKDNPLPGYFINDDEAGVFVPTFTLDDGSGGNADGSDCQNAEECEAYGYPTTQMRGAESEVPNDCGGQRSPGAGTGLEEADAEERGDGPGPFRSGGGHGCDGLGASRHGLRYL